MPRYRVYGTHISSLVLPLRLAVCAGARPAVESIYTNDVALNILCNHGAGEEERKSACQKRRLHFENRGRDVQEMYPKEDLSFVKAFMRLRHAYSAACNICMYMGTIADVNVLNRSRNSGYSV